MDAKWLSTWKDSGRIEELEVSEGKLQQDKDKLEKRRQTWKNHKGCACVLHPEFTRHTLKQYLNDFNGLELSPGTGISHIGILYCPLRRLHDPYQVAV